jgi:hypothetical protein
VFDAPASGVCGTTKHQERATSRGCLIAFHSLPIRFCPGAAEGTRSGLQTRTRTDPIADAHSNLAAIHVASAIERAIKLASGEVREDGYFISLYFSEEGSNAAFAAGFGGSTRILGLQDLPNTHRVALSGGRIGMFRPVSCGGSRAPANLWWEQNGVMYQIQIKLGNGPAEKDQEKILLETANSMVTARRE